MRNISAISLAIIFIACLTSSAFAQTTQPFNWSGPYVGGTLSLVKSHATTDVSTSDSFPGSYFTPPDPEQIANTAHGNIKQSRLGLGGFGGVGRQFGKLYLGLEASISSLRFDGARSSGAIYISNPAGSFNNELSVRANSQAMLRTRLGWTHDRWMTYLTGGVAATRITMDASFSDNFLGAGASGQATSRETKLGWSMGFGGEYALSNNWVIRCEYSYVDYGRVNTSAFVTNPAFPALGNNLINSVDLNAQIFSVGISYRF